MSEILLQKQIVDWLNYQGHFVWRSNTGVFFRKSKNGKTYAFRAGIKGCSDIIGLLKIGKIGVMICIEVKNKKGKLSVPQTEFLEEINKRGGMAFVAISIEDVEREIKSYKKKMFNL